MKARFCGRPNDIEPLGQEGQLLGDGRDRPVRSVQRDSLRRASRPTSSAAADKVNAGDPTRVVELWNLVFIQFNRGDDGRALAAASAQHVDTGMGLERRHPRAPARHRSNYDTDLWSVDLPTRSRIAHRRASVPAAGTERSRWTIAYRVIADHVRCLTVAITDGAIPSNEGRGYVLRRILRRAVRHAHQTLGVEGPLLCDLVPAVVDSLGGAFPELTRNPEHAAQIIRDEEESFLKTLDRGIALFDQAAARAGDGQGISAEDAFQLHDTFGFPIDLTRVMAEERSLSVDENGYERLMEGARERSRRGGDTQRAIGLPADALAQLKFRSVTASDDIDKYHGRPVTATVRAIWNGRDFDDNVDTTERGREYGIVTDRTNFYAEQGGQVGDTGKLRDNDADHSEFTIADTRAFGGYVLHVGEIVRGNIRVGESVQLAIDRERREQIKANHTATHLLNLALRQVLGSDVQQKGSLVAPDRLRFDFSFTHAMSLDQIAEVERIVNEHIAESMPVHASLVPLEKAQEINGVRAVFGERYPDPVRVVSVGVGVDRLLSDPGSAEWMGYTVEFCGGTHLETTDGARRLVIVHEQVAVVEPADDRRAQRTEGVGALGAHPLQIAPLPASLRDVVAGGDPEDMLGGLFDGYAAGRPADDDDQLALVVDVLGVRWDDDIGVRTDDRGRELGEQARVLGDAAVADVTAVVRPIAMTLEGSHGANNVASAAGTTVPARCTDANGGPSSWRMVSPPRCRTTWSPRGNSGRTCRFAVSLVVVDGVCERDLRRQGGLRCDRSPRIDCVRGLRLAGRVAGLPGFLGFRGRGCRGGFGGLGLCGGSAGSSGATGSLGRSGTAGSAARVARRVRWAGAVRRVRSAREAWWVRRWGGVVGSAGSSGAAGSLGRSGTAGSIGSRGVVGSTGWSGVVGSAGSSGAAGSLGRSGTVGPAGWNGVVGSAAGMVSRVRRARAAWRAQEAGQAGQGGRLIAPCHGIVRCRLVRHLRGRPSEPAPRESSQVFEKAPGSPWSLP